MISQITKIDDIYDVIGVGFGPAGIALAVAMEDVEEEKAMSFHLRCLFIEQAPDSAWQPGMLLPGTNIQHHFLRDFATPRNPRSRYTFINYLKEKGRLFSFGILHHDGDPGRVEWADYVQWVATQVSHRALYRHQVIGIEPLCSEESSQINIVRVLTKDLVKGSTKVFYARNIVISTGRKPNIPPQFTSFIGPKVFHAHTFKMCIQHVRPEERPTFAVIGAGQNAIEILLYLADHFPESDIYSITRNSGFRLYDLGHFSNEVYLPEEVDYFFKLSKEERNKLFEEVKFTTYSSVDDDVSRALYWRVYEEGVRGIYRIQMLKRSSISKVVPYNDHYQLLLEDIYLRSTRAVEADIVILCTGYVEEQMPVLLEPIRPYLQVDTDGDLLVGRDYEVCTENGFQVGVFLNGLTERIHGISNAASFSMMALKAQRILERLQARLE